MPQLPGYGGCTGSGSDDPHKRRAASVNFMLWQLAYTEFYFTDVLWPDFNKKELKKAVEYYNGRERRLEEYRLMFKQRLISGLL